MSNSLTAPRAVTYCARVSVLVKLLSEYLFQVKWWRYLKGGRWGGGEKRYLSAGVPE